MDGEILDAVTEWGTRSVSDGVSGLYELADGEFSGAVTDGTAWAFVLNGRFVGVFDGTIEDFEDASLTAHTAPDMSLPLLYAMQARGGEVRGQYYSNETSLSEIDDTLSAGNFVGYVELSENVLSGDYYVVYYGGRSLPVAFVGNNDRLLSGDEAFERADDEVGIYSVVDADVEVVDLPERPEGSESASDAGVAVAPGADADGESGSATEVAANDGDAERPDAEPDAVSTGAGSDAESLDAEPDAVSTGAGSDTESLDAEPDTGVTDTDFGSLGEMSGVEDASDTPAADDEPPVSGTETAASPSETPDESGGDAEAETPSDEREAPPDSTGGDAETVSDHEADDLDRLRRELDAARAAKAEVEAERDRIASERDELSEEVERLRDRVASLESEIERLEAGADSDEAPPERTLAPDEARSGTNMFVRYEDSAGATLERAAQGRVSETELRDNLRLDYHTAFEAEGARVDGQSFEAFLRGTPEYRFAEWLLTAVTYEIRRTDTRADLSKLYEAIEAVDRIDLDGEVDVTVEDAADETTTTSVTFDVVFRDKMGDPLFAAAFDDSRDPTRASAIESPLTDARSVSDAVPAFAATFVVTTSFFDADAMEVAVGATRGGLFSRSSRKSYVKLSRKSGFHLCLVEARDEDFFLTVPDL